MQTAEGDEELRVGSGHAGIDKPCLIDHESLCPGYSPHPRKEIYFGHLNLDAGTR